jgi:hypothetical protein
MHLHITTPQLVRRADGTTTLDLFSCFVDSSHGNGENGTSHGGFLLASRAPPLARPLPPALAERTTAPIVSSVPASAGRTPTSERASLAPLTDGTGGAAERAGAATAAGTLADATPAPSPGAELGGGGALAWRCVAPPAGDDSSAAAELRLATLAYKYVVAARFLQCELEVGAAPAEPTPLYLDAQAVLDGTNCERLAKASRWMAMRYAMLRWGIACGTIAPRKLLTAMNPADGLTKCLTGKPFENGRARLLGLPIPHPGL